MQERAISWNKRLAGHGAWPVGSGSSVQIRPTPPRAKHPVARALKDEYFYFTWLLRHEAFLRFGYDPDAAFSEKVDERGFRR